MSAIDDVRRGLAAAGVKVKMARVPDSYPTLAAWLAKNPDYLLVEDAIAQATDLPPPLPAAAFRPVARTSDYPVFAETPPPEAPEPWGAIVAPAAADAPPPFPLDALPAVLGEMASEIAETYSGAPEYPGMAAIVLAGAAMANKWEIAMKDDHRQYPNLYCLAGMAPTEGKSPMMRLLLKPFKDWAKEQYPRYQNDLAQYNATAKRIEAECNGIKKSIEKARANNAAPGPGAASDLAVLEAERVALGDPPMPPTPFVEDVTSEALAKVLQANDCATAIVSTEGGGVLDNAGGRYNR